MSFLVAPVSGNVAGSGTVAAQASLLAAQAHQPGRSVSDVGSRVRLLQLQALDLARKGGLAAAQEVLARAIALAPMEARSHFLAGRLAEEGCDFEHAQSAYARAVELDPQDQKVRFHQCLNHFSMGRWVDGARAYGKRPLEGHRDSKVIRLPRWDGRSQEGSVLLWAEQGLGDEILFLRFLSVIREHWRSLVIEVDPRLRSLYETNFPEVRFFDRGTAVPAVRFSAQAPHGDLLSLFHQRMVQNALASHCLQVPSEVLSSLSYWEQSADERMRVGISWLTMSPTQPLLRSIPVESLLSVLNPAKHIIVNLQYLAPECDLKCIEDAGFTLLNKHEIDCHQDLVSLAGLISKVDTVLTIDNSTAHLAGALGVDTYVLLPKLANWRWGDMRSNPTWYPRVKVFGQDALGDWSSPLRELEFKFDSWRRG